MTGKIRNAFARYASPCEIERNGEKIAVRAFVQAITKEIWDEPFSVGVLGAVDERIWRYLGEADVPVYEGDAVHFGGEIYRVRRAAAVMAGDEVTHQWAVLAKEVDA